ncbi:hypothetical protein BHE74_00051233 [Ensete ventricosum]|nr:hypothetical protein BHE74_00051233 [Ensete ventricosum]RZS16780.1 hypothetical protein BHM03_00048819 [Ensete ventricosum]
MRYRISFPGEEEEGLSSGPESLLGDRGLFPEFLSPLVAIVGYLYMRVEGRPYQDHQCRWCSRLAWKYDPTPSATVSGSRSLGQLNP